MSLSKRTYEEVCEKVFPDQPEQQDFLLHALAVGDIVVREAAMKDMLSESPSTFTQAVITWIRSRVYELSENENDPT